MLGGEEKLDIKSRELTQEEIVKANEMIKQIESCKAREKIYMTMWLAS